MNCLFTILVGVLESLPDSGRGLAHLDHPCFWYIVVRFVSRAAIQNTHRGVLKPRRGASAKKMCSALAYNLAPGKAYSRTKVGTMLFLLNPPR